MPEELIPGEPRSASGTGVQVTFDRLRLERAVSRANRALPSTTLVLHPLQNCVLLEGAEGRWTVRVAGDKAYVKETLEAEDTGPGACCLNAQLLDQYLRGLTGSEVTFKIDPEHRVTILSGRSRAKPPSEDPHGFPPLLQGRQQASFKLRVGDFRSRFKGVLCCGGQAAPGDDLRFQYAKWVLNLEGSYLVAMDHRRIGFARIRPVEIEGHGQAIVPHTVLSRILPALLPANEDSWVVGRLLEGALELELGSTLLQARLGDVGYPPLSEETRRLAGTETQVILEASPLAQALQSQLALTRSTDFPVQLETFPETSELEVRLPEGPHGMALHRLECGALLGEKGVCRTSAKALQDAVLHLGTESVVLAFGGQRLLCVTPLGEEDRWHLLSLMTPAES